MAKDAQGDGCWSSGSFFDWLYETHRDAVFAFLMGRLADRETSLDLLQETFLRAWRNIGSLESMSPPERRRYWLFTVARNLLTDHYRRTATRETTETQLQQEQPAIVSRSEMPGESLEARERLFTLDAAIRRLPEDQRTALTMQVMGGMNSEQIGTALGRPSGTIRYWIARARRSLAQEVGLMEREQGA